jgi:methylase of polypeptide subunit release factors
VADALSEILMITNPSTPSAQRRLAMKDFAQRLAWSPSFDLRTEDGSSIATDHLIVEHGLENSAVITFLKTPNSAAGLDESALRAMQEISYNNLIEWHLFVSGYDFRLTNNLSGSVAEEAAAPLVESYLNETLSSSILRDKSSSTKAGRRIKPCDDALIEAVSRWKRLLDADLGVRDASCISALFNGIFFVRGCEDRKLDFASRARQVLLDATIYDGRDTVNLGHILRDALLRLDIDADLKDFIDVAKLTPFADVDFGTALNLFRDFYRSGGVPYSFNFALLSKHALSRIYERYVSMFEELQEPNRQISLFGSPRKLIAQYKSGSVYTPQFISSFFSKYIQQNMTPRRFRDASALDPACGSGIFLRNLLELKCDPFDYVSTSRSIEEAFANVSGYDIDNNAVEASRLSLALLFLVVTGRLPRAVGVSRADSLARQTRRGIVNRRFDIVVSNPPYIRHDALDDQQRDELRTYLGADARGKLDAYLGFLKLGVDALGPHGIGCFVLPEVVLHAENAAPLRRYIAKSCAIRCLVDLSALPVFEGIGTYNVLLIVEKRVAGDSSDRRAVVAKITDFAGAALNACLEDQQVRNPYYQVFSTGPEFFDRDAWTVLPPEFLALEKQLSHTKRVEDLFTVSQGYVSGLDRVFIRKWADVPARERELYMDYLPDKLIQDYALPKSVEEAVFYPYDREGGLVAEARLEADFPETWAYLNGERRLLSARGPVKVGATPWWRPERPRPPKLLRRPKIVCPHIVLAPRFGIDLAGRYAVSRTPFLVNERQDDEETVLKFYCAVLNAPVAQWHIRQNAPTFGGGYSRLEANVLRRVPVPSLKDVNYSDLQVVLSFVDKAMDGVFEPDEEREAHIRILRMYGLTSEWQQRLLLS